MPTNWTKRTRIDPNVTYDSSFAYDSNTPYDVARLGSQWNERTPETPSSWDKRTRIDVRV